MFHFIMYWEINLSGLAGDCFPLTIEIIMRAALVEGLTYSHLMCVTDLEHEICGFILIMEWPQTK